MNSPGDELANEASAGGPAAGGEEEKIRFRNMRKRLAWACWFDARRTGDVRPARGLPPAGQGTFEGYAEKIPSLKYVREQFASREALMKATWFGFGEDVPRSVGQAIKN